MQRLLIIGCGDIARRALPWLVRHYRVYAAVRSDARLGELRAMGVTPLRADLDRPHTLRRLAGIANLILHFAPPQESGRQDARMRALLAALSTGKILPRRLVYISTSGVYGDCGGAWVSEERPLRPQTARAQRRADAEARLRRFGRARRIAVSILRAPGIYAGDRLPLARLARGLPLLRDEDDIHTNHIHADDLAAIARRALARGRPGRIYNAAAAARRGGTAPFPRHAVLHGRIAPPDQQAHQARTRRAAEVSRCRHCAGLLATGGNLKCCGSSGCTSFSW